MICKEVIIGSRLKSKLDLLHNLVTQDLDEETKLKLEKTLDKAIALATVGKAEKKCITPCTAS